MEKKYAVYQHVTPDGMYYFGQSQNVEKRWECNGIHYRDTSLQPYIEKFGWENIQHIVLFRDQTKEDALWIEDFLIETAQEDGVCINKNRSGLVSKEEGYKQRKDKNYREQNREKIREQKREYREKNREKHNEQQREYQRKNREKIREQKREYYEQNREKYKEYREKNREKHNEQQREYQRKNREKIREYQREYKEKNREKYKEYHRQYRQKKKLEKQLKEVETTPLF